MAENNEPDGQSLGQPVPRRHTAPDRHAPPAAPATREKQLANLVDSVKVLANQLKAEPVEPPESSKDRALRRKKKFQRVGSPEEPRLDPSPNDPVASVPAADPVPGGEAPPIPPATAPPERDALDAAALNRSIAWPRQAREETRAVRPRRQRSTTQPLLVLLACNLFVLVLGYWLGQAAATGTNPQGGANKTPVPDSPPPAAANAPSATDRALDAANAALKAERGGDTTTARRLYNDALQQRVGLPGMEYRLALIAIQRGDLLDADLHLVHSTAAGEAVGPCSFIRATFAGAKGNYAEAGRQLEAAVRAEPFNAKYYFCWGECLRRQGKPHAAASALEQALARAYNPEDGDLYLFKLGLAKLEFGHDEAFNDSLARRIQEPTVTGDWWLLAAAQNLAAGAFPAAAEHLQKAMDVMPAALFDSRVRDFFFQQHVKQPEVASYLNHTVPPTTTEAGASIMDPNVWVPSKADPGTWPSANAAGR